jgi:gas vesicle structural protein
MGVAQATSGGYLERPRPSGLADVIDVILDKGLVIDAYVRVSLIGIEILTIDARIVIASVDTYLRFAEAVNRLDLREDSSQGLPELMESMTSGGSQSKTKGVLEGAKESLASSDEDEDQEKPRARRSSSSRRRKSS